MTPVATSHGMAFISPELVLVALNFQSMKSFSSCAAEYGSASRFSPASRNCPTILVSSPITSGTPCLAARAARYFLLISPNGCSTKLTFTPGWDCSNKGITVSIETLSKYQTVSSVLGALVSSADAGSEVAAPATDVGAGRSAAGAIPELHAVTDTLAATKADKHARTDGSLRLAIIVAPPTSLR